MPPVINIINVVTIGVVFILVMALWMGGVLIWAYRKNAQQAMLLRRLGVLAEQGGQAKLLRLWHEGKEVATLVPAGQRQGLWSGVEQVYKKSGWKMPLVSLILAVAGVDIALFLAGWIISSNPVLGFALPAAADVIVWVLVKQAAGRRDALFEQQLVDALDLACRSLRAGHPLVGAFRLVGEEVAEPVGTVFNEICQQQALGRGLDEAISMAGDSSGNNDMRIFSTSVAIQIRSGGNLADMMERLAAVIRDRMRLSRRVRVLTAQTQLSKKILLALPVVLFVGLNIINRGYMAPLYATTPGRLMLLGAILGMLLGAWMMNRLAVLRY